MKYKLVAGLLALVVVSFLLMGLIPVSAMGDTYGAESITNLFAGLWVAFWPLIALLFIIEIILRLFGAPSFLGTIFGALKSKRG